MCPERLKSSSKHYLGYAYSYDIAKAIYTSTNDRKTNAHKERNNTLNALSVHNSARNYLLWGQGLIDVSMMGRRDYRVIL